MQREATALGKQEEMRQALASSFLADQPEQVISRLLEGASLESPVAGEIVFRAGDGQPSLILTAKGLMRVVLSAPNGRQATARYAGEGEISGLPPLLAAGIATTVEAMTSSRIVRLSGERFMATAANDTGLAWAIARYLARQLETGLEMLGADIFFPVRLRVARHLLDLAEREDSGLVVMARHQHIADAIGSVREVVSREMKRLADEGVLERVGDTVVITDPAELHRIASGDQVTLAR